MTTQGNQPSADLADEARTAPATHETAASPAPSPAAPVGDEGREPTTASGEPSFTTIIHYHNYHS